MWSFKPRYRRPPKPAKKPSKHQYLFHPQSPGAGDMPVGECGGPVQRPEINWRDTCRVALVPMLPGNGRRLSRFQVWILHLNFEGVSAAVGAISNLVPWLAGAKPDILNASRGYSSITSGPVNFRLGNRFNNGRPNSKWFAKWAPKQTSSYRPKINGPRALGAERCGHDCTRLCAELPCGTEDHSTFPTRI